LPLWLLHTQTDPIDDPLGNLEEDDEADENEDGGDGENASGEIWVEHRRRGLLIFT
ncbi:hypothetical protein HAX54_036217, partial [Datura stramonium]|nr:hypothetical protein [Datura stramonium]